MSSNINPIDAFLINLADNVTPLFHKMNYSPNGITTFSLILSAAALYYLAIRDFTRFSVYYLLSYFFDLVEHRYARQYMKSNKSFQNHHRYTHIKNLGVGLLFAYILFDQYNLTEFPIILIVLICFLVLMMMNVGCNEKLHQIKPSKLVEMVTPSDEKCSKHMSLIKHFGPKTVVSQAIILIVVWYLTREYETNIQKNTLNL